MKRILLSLLIVIMWPVFAIAEGVCTTAAGATISTSAVNAFLGRGNLDGRPTNTVAHEFSCVADGATGSLPDVILTNVGGALDSVCIDWGATAPTTGAYDIYVKSDEMADADLLGGEGVDLATTSDICLTPVVGGVYKAAPFYGDVTVSQAGTTENSATPTITLNFKF